MYEPAGKKEERAVDISKKASISYKELTPSSKEALRNISTAERKMMTRAEVKQRANKIGRKIKELVMALV